MARKYAFKDYNPEKMARVYGSDLSISSKHAIEICTKLHSKTLNQAKDILNDVINIKKPIEFRRFSHGAGHKKGNMAAGKFPIKASQEVLKLVESLEANAQQKGLNTAGLVLIHICANRASSPMHYGRRSGRAMKRSHVEMIAEEKEIQKPKARPKPKVEKKEEPKKLEAKPEPRPEPKPKPKPEQQPNIKKKEEVKEEPKPKVEEKKPEEKKEESKVEEKETPKPEAKPEQKPETKESQPQSPKQEVNEE